MTKPAWLFTYTPSQIASISPERLHRFFVQVEGGYQISKPVRELCVFARQNLISDPPFSRLDLITCRNVLIYLGTFLQQKLLPLFHYGLKATGFLMLGSSETVGDFSDLFALIDKKNKIYTRKIAASRLDINPSANNYPLQISNPQSIASEDNWNDAEIQKQADQIVLNQYAPVGVIVNDELEILQFRGQTNSYLQPAPGRASLNLLKMVKEELRLELRTAIHQAKKQEVSVRVVLVEIDALKRSMEQLRASRDYAEAIVETVREPLLVLNVDLRAIAANRSFYEVFQVAIAETEQRSIFDLGNRQWDNLQLRSRLEDLLANGTQFQNFEVEFDFEEIGQKTMLLNARKMPQVDEVQLILLAIKDITEGKRLQAQQAQLLIREQTARSVAEETNRTKDEFLSTLSHELRNPLNYIVGWASMLRTKKLNETQTAQGIETIERGAKALNQLIEDILDISRITTGKFKLNPQVVEIAPLVRAAIAIVHLSADAKNIKIQSRLASTTENILGDPTRLQQIIWNLLTNAIKFTPKGGKIKVTLKYVDAQAQIQVSDTGQGISSEFLPYVFDRFRQADGSQTRSNSGLGLGLSIVRHLVELHGGTVRAESPGEGQGATFTVRLPLRLNLTENATLGNLKSTTDKSKVSIDDLPSIQGVRVLIVDDDADLREFFVTALEPYGVTVTAISSVSEALSTLAANPQAYDVLLSDIGMPEEDGYALIRQVRALSVEAGGQIPAAALTAYASEEDCQKAIAQGFQMHVAKPVKPTQLVRVVADLAGRN